MGVRGEDTKKPAGFSGRAGWEKGGMRLVPVVRVSAGSTSDIKVGCRRHSSGGALCLSVRDADVCWLETGGMLNVAARLSEVGGTAGGRGLPQIADRRDPGRRQASKKFSSEKKYQMTESLVTLVRLNESAHIGQIAIFSRAKITDRILAGLKSWL